VVIRTKRRATEDTTQLWRDAADLFVRAQSSVDTRLSHLESDVAVLKDDVAVLKDDVAVLKDDVGVLKGDVACLKDDVHGIVGQLGRMERAAIERDQKIAAELEKFSAWIKKDELKKRDRNAHGDGPR
jgi:hypothetical protein